MARKKPGSLRSLSRSIEKNLDDEYLGSSQRYTSTNENQSDLLPSRPPAARAPAARSKPSAAPAPRRTAPLPPRRPRPTPGPRNPEPGPGGPPDYPIEPTWPKDVPFIPGTPPLQMPQFDPMGNPTGPMAPPAPGSSTQGYPGLPQPTDMIPPMTGPGADRNIPGGQPDIGQSLQPGQSAASSLWQGIQDRFNNPMASPITPPGGGVPAGAAGGPVMPPPQTGPGSDRTPPPGLLGSLGGIPDFLKRNIPPFGGI